MMTRFNMLALSTLLVLSLVASPAHAWGPRAESAIVSTALHVVSGAANIPLKRFEKEVQQGALVPSTAMLALYPDLSGNPVAAIEAEMILLRAMNKNKVDPYFAYRLGILGKLVASVSAPLTRGDENYQSLYFADVESRIVRTPLEPSSRTLVEPKSYFARRIDEANINTSVIEEEYRDGIGFGGIASTMLSQDVSRAANAVADVWYSILAGPEIAGGVSQAQVQDYVLEAFRFYIQRGSLPEIDAAAKRLDELVPRSADQAASIGDLYYENEMYERAMEEYKTALALEPGRRDVTEKMSEYYVRVGQDALSDERLEDALGAFETAINANALHPTAEARRIEAATMIRDREERLAYNQSLLDEAAGFADLAEREAQNQRYADAVSMLREAKVRYDAVTDEFPLEFQRRLAGTRSVEARLVELKNELIGSAQDFSGSGFALDAQDMAKSFGNVLDQQALRALIRAEYQNQLRTIESEVADKMRVR